MVAVPSFRFRSAGPMATVSVPASTTSASTEPAATSAFASFGLVRPSKTGLPPARTSTAGAAAVCRTISRALPAPTLDTSLTNGVICGSPAALRWAARLMFAPPGTAASSTFRIALSIASPGLVRAMSYSPSGRVSGPATSPGLKLFSVFSPLTYTSTGVSGMPWTTETFDEAA